MTVLASFARVYVSDLAATISLLRRSSDEPPRLRFSHSSGLEIALVGDVLVLAGPDDVLASFRETQVTQVVDDLEAALDAGRSQGGLVVRGPAGQPTGRNATLRHPGGAVVEYVEWSSEVRAEVGL